MVLTSFYKKLSDSRDVTYMCLYWYTDFVRASLQFRPVLIIFCFVLTDKCTLIAYQTILVEIKFLNID